MTDAKDSTPAPMIWLTCRDLYLGNVKGCIDHTPDRLFGIDRAKDCDCEPNVRWDADSCADPYVHRIADSRFGLRLCCRCHAAFERAVRTSAGYASDPCAYLRLPASERQRIIRRFVARAVWAEWHESGFVADWQPGFPKRAAYWRDLIAAERREVAA